MDLQEVICPYCRRRDCYIRNGYYTRSAIELGPYCHHRVKVQICWCKKTKMTFSLLPCQLAPYFRYVVSSILWLLWFVFERTTNMNESIESAADQAGDSPVLPRHISFWSERVIAASQRCLSELGVQVTGRAPPDRLQRVVFYLRLLACQQQLPALVSLEQVILHYCSTTGFHYL